MLRLVEMEFLKLRRRRFFWGIQFAALVMPGITLFYFRDIGREGIDSIEFYKWTALSYTPWFILPMVLGMVSTMLIYDENQNDTLKQLWIVPVSKVGLLFSKFIVVMIYSICFMLITAASSVLCGVLFGYIASDWDSICYLIRKCIEIAVLTALAMMPILSSAAAGKGYILPVCVTLVYTFLGFILLMINMYLHPLSSVEVIVTRDIPGVVMTQALNIPAAFLCIAVWDVGSVVVGLLALRKK